jgi:hypothetical protein
MPPMLIPFEIDEAGEILAPTASPITAPRTGKFNGLDPRTPRFRTAREKDAFEATLPTAVQAQLNQPFGKDTDLNQCFYLQKTGNMTLLLLYKSGFLSNSDKKKLERVYKPARKLVQLWKRYRDVDFAGLRGFQAGWETQTELSKAQEDMTMACLFHFNLSLPAVVRWIGGPHTAEHRDNEAIFARLKDTCSDGNFRELVRIFTKGSPTYVNAKMSQDEYKAYREFGNHASIDENPEMVNKTVVKEVARGFALTLNPDIFDYLENVRQTPHGILYLDHPRKKPRVICDSSLRPYVWCNAINDVTDKRNEPKLMFAGSFVATLKWIWNLRITYPHAEIYLCDDDVSAAFRQAKYHPNLAGFHCYVLNGVLFVATGQTFGDTTSPPNFEPIALCRMEHAQALWHRTDTVERTLPLLPEIQHQDPPTADEIGTFVQANRDSKNLGVLDEDGNRKPPEFRHHVDDDLFADVLEHLERSACASALALYEILGFPDGRQVGALSLDKLDTLYGPRRTLVGYKVDSRAMTVTLLPHKRIETAEMITPWLTMKRFTLLQGAEICGKLEDASTCCRWIRPYFFAIQNTIRAALLTKGKRIRGYYKRMGVEKIRAAYALPKHMERRLASLIARDMAKLLWHSKATFEVPDEVRQTLELIRNWLRDPTVLWEKSIAHWIDRDPTFVSAGDASQRAGGGLCAELKFWFDVQWSPRVQNGCKLAADHPEYIHINVLEFVVVLIQLAACIVALESGYAGSLQLDIPHIPHLLAWTDNKVSKAWSNKVTTSSRRAQPLLGVLSGLLMRSNIGFGAGFIAGIDNDIPDFISRPELSNFTAVSHFDRAQQIFAYNDKLTHWRYFRPSLELCSLLESLLFSGRWAAPPSLPKNLGHFEPTVCTGSLFVSI